MQAFSIWGFLLALANTGRCSAAIGLGLQDLPEAFQGLKDNENNVEAENKAAFKDDDTPGLLDDKFFIDDPDQNGVGSLDQEIMEKLHSLKNATKPETKRHKRRRRSIGIPVLKSIYTGPDDPSDVCERDEIMHVDGECHQILSQGPCEDTEFVLMDPSTKKGYCAPRLCNPDRVFVFGDQLCHDPFENSICPPGRILFTTSVGSPACGCPYGTYEEEDDLDEDDCQPILGKLESCGPGEVFWFTSFRREPECIPDPCKGINAKRSPGELPYAPASFDGKCYQLSQEIPQCPDDTFYTLSYTNLSGICASLEDAGYTVLDDEMLETYANLFGSPLPRDTSLSSFSSSSVQASSPSRKRFGIPDIGSLAIIPSFDPKSNHLPLKIGQSVTRPVSRITDDDNGDDNELPDVQLHQTHVSAYSPAAISVRSRRLLPKLFSRFETKKNPPVEDEQEENEEHEHTQSNRRSRRDSSPYASPETVFQSSLAQCRAGGEVGINFKCNTKYLPNRLPLSRPKRNIAAISPFPPCRKGSLYSIRRRCVSNESKVRNSLIAHGLG